MTTSLGPESYVPTNEDRIWLLRAVQGEGPPHELVAQALLNRFMLLRSKNRRTYPTLADFVQAYSQPINPRWLKGGARHEAAMRTATTEQRAELIARTERRARMRALTQFDPAVERAVDRALAVGPVDLPTPDTTDFAHVRLSLKDHLEETGVVGSQRFSRVLGQTWPGYTVHTTATVLPLAGLLVVVAAIALTRRN